MSYPIKSPVGFLGVPFPISLAHEPGKSDGLFKDFLHLLFVGLSQYHLPIQLFSHVDSL